MSETIFCKDLAAMLGLRVNTIRSLCKNKNTLLRPPGYFSGRVYHIFTSELDDYLHGTGRYEGAGFPKAMEVTR